MYGEKVEETQELRLDLADVKEMYKSQVNKIVPVECLQYSVVRIIVTTLYDLSPVSLPVTVDPAAHLATTGADGRP